MPGQLQRQRWRGEELEAEARAKVIGDLLLPLASTYHVTGRADATEH